MFKISEKKHDRFPKNTYKFKRDVFQESSINTPSIKNNNINEFYKDNNIDEFYKNNNIDEFYKNNNINKFYKNNNFEYLEDSDSDSDKSDEYKKFNEYDKYDNLKQFNYRDDFFDCKKCNDKIHHEKYCNKDIIKIHGFCIRCGRAGHVQNRCKFKNHIDGSELF